MSDADFDENENDNTASDDGGYLSRAEILDHAIEIAQEFADDGMDITLRQLYYQFVSRGLTGSGQRVYKRIGDVVTEARYTGEFPLEQLVDRGRSIAPGDYTRCDMDPIAAEQQAAGIIKSVPAILMDVDRWYGQDTFVSVWVEKQALEGVFQPICDELGVSWFACKGYPSVSALWQWLQRAQQVCGGQTERRMLWPGGAEVVEKHKGHAASCVVLYFGDHDPDGWEIPRSAERNLRRLMELRNIDIGLRFERIALNADQIKQYNPPPFEAKMTSARYRGYVKEHNTQDAWELDALNPRVLRALIKREVSAFFDETLHGRLENKCEMAQDQLRRTLRDPEFIRRSLL